MKSHKKPQKRGQLRQYFGKKFFVYKRILKWMTGKERFAKNHSTALLPFSQVKHQSFLLRQLKDVDMYLQENKTVNLGLAIQKLDALIIKPNETFSFWYIVGNPNKRKGYKQGLVLSNGQITKGIGGGLCQLGNLIYWMVLHSPLTVTERYRHSYDVFPDVNRKIPFGSGATLAYNYIDLQFKNTTNTDFQLHLYLDETHLHGELLSQYDLENTYSIEEKNHEFRQQYWGGYTRHNQIWKKVFDKNKKQTSEELVTENHAIMMYEPFLKAKQ
jgi:vancomycin resistance protein VanW